MATELATAYVQIVPSADGMTGKISEALGNEAEKAGDDAGNKVGSSMLSSIAKTLAGGAAAIAAAAGTMIGAVVSGTKELAAYGDNIDKMSQKFGISSQAYQEWDAVLRHSGTSIEAMKPAFKNLASMAENNASAFEKLGLSQEQVASMSTEDLFAASISGLQGMEEGSERAALATELFGRAGMELGPLLNTSSEDTQAMIDRVNELGGVLSEDAVKASAAFQDSMQDMQTAMTGLKNGLLVDFLPGFTTVIDGLTELFGGDSGKGVELIKQGIESIGTGIQELIPQILEIVQSLVDSLLQVLVSALPSFLDTGLNIISSMITGISDNLPNIISTIIQMATQLLSTIIQRLPEFIAMGVKLIGSLVQGLISAIPQILSSIGSLCSQMMSSFQNINWSSVGSNIISGIVNGLVAFGGKIASTLKDLAKKAFDSVLDFFGIHSPSTLFRDMVGKNIAVGWAEGIEDNANSVSDAIDEVNDMVIDGVNTNFEVDAVARYQPARSESTINYGGVNINIAATDYANAKEIAKEVSDIIMFDIKKKGAVFA